jgi:hypothetical protein
MINDEFAERALNKILKIRKMNQFFADIEIRSSFDFAKGEKVRCLAMPEVNYLFINEEIKRRLGLQMVGKRVFETEEKERVELEMVGPIEMTCLGQSTSTQAVVLPGNKQPLIGSVAIFALHLKIDQANNQLIVNPKPYRI